MASDGEDPWAHGMEQLLRSERAGHVEPIRAILTKRRHEALAELGRLHFTLALLESRGKQMSLGISQLRNCLHAVDELDNATSQRSAAISSVHGYVKPPYIIASPPSPVTSLSTALDAALHLASDGSDSSPTGIPSFCESVDVTPPLTADPAQASSFDRTRARRRARRRAAPQSFDAPTDVLSLEQLFPLSLSDAPRPDDPAANGDHKSPTAANDAPCVHAHALLDAYAEDAAIGDALALLDRQMQARAVQCGDYVKAVGALARQQFITRTAIEAMQRDAWR